MPNARPSSDASSAGWVNESEGTDLWDHLDGDLGEFVQSHRRHLNGPKRILFFTTDDGARYPMDHMATITTCVDSSRVGQLARQNYHDRILTKGVNCTACRTDHSPCSPGRAAFFCGNWANNHFNTKVAISEYLSYVRNGSRAQHIYDQEWLFPGPIERDCALQAGWAFYRDVNTGTASVWSSGTTYTVGQQVKKYCTTWDVLTQYTVGDEVQLSSGHRYTCTVLQSTVGSSPTVATSEWTDQGANTAHYRYFIAKTTTTAGRAPEWNCSDLSPQWRDYGSAETAAALLAQTPVKAHSQPFGDCTSTARNTEEARGDGAAAVWESSVTYSSSAWIVCGTHMYKSRINNNTGHQPFPADTTNWQDKGIWHDDLQYFTGSWVSWLAATNLVKLYEYEKVQNGIGLLGGTTDPVQYQSADPDTATVDYWLSGTTYASGAKVAWLGYFYTSLSAGNVGHQPDTSPTFWGSPTPAYTTRNVAPGWRRSIVSADDVQDHYRNTHIDFDEAIGGPNPIDGIGQIGRNTSLRYDYELDSLTYDSGTNLITAKTIDPMPTEIVGTTQTVSCDRMTGGSNWFLAEGQGTVVDQNTITYTPVGGTPNSTGGTRTGATTSTGSAQVTVTGGSPSSADIGCMVSGTNIQAGTRITAWNSGTSQYTLSKPATNNGSGITLTIGVNINIGFIYIRKYFETWWYGAQHVDILNDVSLYDNLVVYHGFHMPHWSAIGTAGVRDDVNTQNERRYENSQYSAVPNTQAWYWGGVSGAHGPDVDPTEATNATFRNTWMRRQNMFASMDDQIGFIMDAWDAKFGAGTYFVIIVDDNGYQYGGHHVGGTEGNATEDVAWSPVGGKTFSWENSVRVSLVLAGPGFPQNVTKTILCELADIPLTIMRIMAEAIPSLNNHHCFTKRDGTAIQDQIEGTATKNYQFCKGLYQEGASGLGPGGEVKHHPKIVDKDGNTLIRLWSGSATNIVIESQTPAVAWVSGHSYAVGDQVIDSGGVSTGYYTCILATSGTTAPHSDATHWAPQYRQYFTGNGAGSGVPNETEYETVDHTFDSSATQALSDTLATKLSILMTGRWEAAQNKHTGKIS